MEKIDARDFIRTIAAGIHEHIKIYNLGNILSEVLICVQNDSEKAKRGLFGSTETNQTDVVLTPCWLIWALIGSKTPVSVLSALLQDVVIQDYADTALAKMVPDLGIEVNGKFTDMVENTSAFIGLENNAAGKKFKDLVISTVQDVKK